MVDVWASKARGKDSPYMWVAPTNRLVALAEKKERSLYLKKEKLNVYLFIYLWRVSGLSIALQTLQPSSADSLDTLYWASRPLTIDIHWLRAILEPSSPDPADSCSHSSSSDSGSLHNKSLYNHIYIFINSIFLYGLKILFLQISVEFVSS